MEKIKNTVMYCVINRRFEFYDYQYKASFNLVALREKLQVCRLRDSHSPSFDNIYQIKVVTVFAYIGL